MKNLCFAALLLCATGGFALPIASSARSMVPSELQQLIGVDYRALKDSPTAQALKQQVLPDNLKELETALKGIGIDSDHDLDQLDFASFRTEEGHTNHWHRPRIIFREGRPQEAEAQQDCSREIWHG
jgi:hypothetical protein